MWDPTIGLGTVTHQTIGYLFPLGPYYWVMDRFGVPDWLHAAALARVHPVRRRGRRAVPVPHARLAGPRRRGGVVRLPALAYVLHYAARLSVILLPWAALPWLIACTVLALRRGGWRWPAVFALITLTVGGVNATSLLLAGIGPLLWLPYAVWVAREVTWTRAVAGRRASDC